ncbi:DUF397 domain-containing protein [Streptomyces qinzhouensis]|uniref:DUF397 domain-containing protein n=1 Tax=Streptomyces qinzhouensis TaxID=2599401 RepID=A0A5B8J6E3_9ACTN|nr:DUF397 domain-containing protein [Streptomyces qinzhouensis]QDY77375.1 DUF397 domain-containing protein [Streptomyces qinzhouensis]
MTTGSLNWIKSSYSGSGGSCVEWAPEHAFATAKVPVRDSKCVDGPVLIVSAHAFTGLVAGVKAGDLGAI